jgi:Tfp pilus assembly protein PilX
MKVRTRNHQGWALPTVMAVLGLGALGALSLARGVLPHANLLRSDGDEWRARGAAEALLREAEQDLMASFAAIKDARHSTPAADAVPTVPFIPHTLAGLAQLRKALPTGLCKDGICAPETLEPATAAVWVQRLNSAARYGQYTGGAAVKDSQVNPVLADRSGYWLEAYANADRAQTSPLWRITALAQASPRSTPIVLQAWWQGTSDTSPVGRWLSWHEVLP